MGLFGKNGRHWFDYDDNDDDDYEGDDMDFNDNEEFFGVDERSADKERIRKDVEDIFNNPDFLDMLNQMFSAMPKRSDAESGSGSDDDSSDEPKFPLHLEEDKTDGDKDAALGSPLFVDDIAEPDNKNNDKVSEIMSSVAKGLPVFPSDVYHRAVMASAERQAVCDIVERQLRLPAVRSVTCGTVVVHNLLAEVMQYADSILVGILDTVYLSVFFEFQLAPRKIGSSFWFRWSTEGGMKSLPTDTAWDWHGNPELLQLVIGDMIEEMLDEWSQEDGGCEGDSGAGE